MQTSDVETFRSDLDSMLVSLHAEFGREAYPTDEIEKERVFGRVADLFLEDNVASAVRKLTLGPPSA